MTEQPPAPRPRRLLILWSVALGVLILTGVLCWLVVVPVMRVRRLTERLSGTKEWGDPLKELGGPEQALSLLSLYVRMPQRVAPSKWVAVELLGRCGERAVPVIVRAVEDQEADVREVAANGLWGVPLERLGDAGVQALIAALGDRAPRVRFAAARSLGKLGADTRDRPGAGLGPVVSALREALKDASVILPAWSEPAFGPDRTVRDRVLESLGEIGPPAAEAAGDIEKLLSGQSAGARFYAARSLWQITGQAEKSVPPLVELTKGKYPWNTSAMYLLGQMGSAAKPAIPALEYAAKHGGQCERQEAAEALQKIGAAEPESRTENAGGSALPPHLQHWPGLFVRQGSRIVDAPEEDVAVAKRYPRFADKGPVVNGVRFTILTAKRDYAIDEPVRVIHVCEAPKPGVGVPVMGPADIYDEFVDGKRVRSKEPPSGYSGAVIPSPAVNYNFEITEYRFAEPGRHTIQWRPCGRPSNIIVIEVGTAAGERPK